MTQTEALKLALEALEKLTNAAEGFSVSGVYFNEELWARKCLDDAYDAMGFAQEALAQQSNEQVEPSHVWAKVEEYADSVHDFNEAVRIDVGIDEVGKKCLAIEKELKEMLAHSPVPTAQPKEPEQEPVPDLYVKDINGNFHPYKEKGHTVSSQCVPPSLVGVGEADFTPVARVVDDGTPEGSTEWIPFTNRIEPLKVGDLLYTTTPQRTWVGLTIQEANELWESTDSDWELMKRTEAKLKKKNE